MAYGGRRDPTGSSQSRASDASNNTWKPIEPRHEACGLDQNSKWIGSLEKK